MTADPRRCPVCGGRVDVEPDHPAVAFSRETGEPVALCEGCTDAVHRFARASRCRR